MKSLFIIQKIVKVCSIVSKVIMILCFVAAGCSIFSYVSFNALPASDITSVLQSMVGYDSTFENFTFQQLQGMLLASFVSAITWGILLFFVNKYCTAELIEGTPFTEAGVSNIRLVGILCIVLPFISDLLISYIALKCSLTGQLVSEESPLIVGLLLIVLSFVFQYGTELLGKVKENDNNNQE